MSSRPSSAKSYFGNTFSDGEKLKLNSTRIGGMAVTEAWKARDVSRPSSASAAKRHLTNGALISEPIQKRGAAKTHIPGDLTKPFYLKRALQNVYEELRILGALGDEPGSERRFQVYTEAFDHFIREFHAYEPLLTDVKREYELTIENLRDQLNQFGITKTKLSVMEYKMAKEIQQTIDTNKHIIESMRLQQQNLKDSLVDKEHVLVKLQKENVELIKQNRDLENALNHQKVDISPELIELKQQVAEYAEYERKTSALLDSKDNQLGDLLALKKKLQSELLDSTTALGKLKHSTVPKEAFKDLEAKFQTSDANQMKYKEDNHILTAQKVELEKALKEAKGSLQKTKLSQLPNWDYIQSQFTPSIKQYSDLARKMDFNDAIVAIIRESIKDTKQAPAGGQKQQPIPQQPAQTEKPEKPHTSSSFAGAKSKTDGDYFIPKGIGNGIPKFLRTKNKIANRNLSKANVLLLINDTWEAKQNYDATHAGESNLTLADFFYMYLKKRFGSQDVICEWGYNLTEACLHYKESSLDCAYFLAILNGEMEESVYKDLKIRIEMLKTAVYRSDVTSNFGVAKGYLDKHEFMNMLIQEYPEKSFKQRNTLEDGLSIDQPGDMIVYRFLFENETSSVFLESFKRQFYEDRIEYIEKLSQELIKLSRDDTLSAFEADKMLRDLDPMKKQDKIEEYIARGFGIPVDQLSTKKVIAKTKFLANIQKGTLQKGN